MDMFVGIDIGSLYFHLVAIDEEGNVQRGEYFPHKGDILQSCVAAVRSLDPSDRPPCVVTGAGGAKIDGLGDSADSVVCMVEGAKHLFPGVRNILYIGAGSFTLIRLNERGEYVRHSANSACASGTGAFLDQQAFRLNFTPEELSAAASRAGRCPSVATRCAVFAKTDMIHLQQEGYTPDEIAAGLCRSLGLATSEMMLKGRRLKGRTVFIGGVAKNRKVREAVEEKVGLPIEVAENPELVQALGAAVLARRMNARPPSAPEAIRKLGDDARKKLRRPPLELRLSKYPDFKTDVFYIDEDENEVSMPRKLPAGSVHKVVLGLDIGSTSTKAALMDSGRNVLALVYRYTSGDPVRATQLVFKAVLDLARKEGIEFEVVSAGTTGSGRKMIRAVIGAEMEKDEITAHARAATFIDPAVDTIIEIGGQDSKFTQLRNGVVYNSVMNYVCAAGTGSFIAEQAKNLGISIWDYAGIAMGVAAPQSSDRCTVFMERDLKELLSLGFTKAEAAAAVLHSVRANYLNKVVNGLQIGAKVYFQGATARNKALVAAFENELGKEILVSPYCHVTGSIGLCLMLLDLPEGPRTFKGLAFAGEKVQTSSEICELCRNRCSLTIIRTSGDTVAWGLKCGREYSETRKRKKDDRPWEVFERRKALFASAGSPEAPPAGKPAFRAGVPLGLTSYNYAPMWRAFFAALGGELILSGPSRRETFLSGKEQMTAEFCAPFVLAAGHVNDLLDRDVDFLFLPHMIREEQKGDFADCHFCCYVQGFPSVVRSLESLASHGGLKTVCPTIQLGYKPAKVADEIFRHLSRAVDVSRSAVVRAFNLALAVQKRFEGECRRMGAGKLAELEAGGGMGIVVVGRPYNLYDGVLNLDLPPKIGEKGVTVLPMDCLPLNVEDLSPEWNSMFWNYGQKILRAAEFIRDTPNLFGVFFTNFACGPDSYIVTYFKEIMAEASKPYLVLQFDGHGADAGYLTRIEAAIESFKAWKKPAAIAPRKGLSTEGLPGRTILIPPMDPVSVNFFAPAFERFGFRTAVLEENAETLALGYKHTLGGECVPCPSTLGSTLAYMEKNRLEPSRAALFMPGASGPCRFGQYCKLDSILFEKKGWTDFLILTPSADNAYQGLPQKLRKLLWDAIVIGDVFQKIVFKLRPYEAVPGEVDRVAAKWISAVGRRFAAPKGDIEEAFRQAMAEFASVRTVGGGKPKIAIVGEIYVRNNHFLTQDLFRLVESRGGEVLKTTVGEWIEYTAYLARHLDRGGLHGMWNRIDAFLNNLFLSSHHRKWYGLAGALIADREEPRMEEVIELGRKYVPVQFEGEAILTIGRALKFILDGHVDAVINASPTFCMPGTITTAIFSRIEEEYGVPCICLFYDGSGAPNLEVVPHMHFLASARRASSGAEKVGSAGSAAGPGREG